MSKYYARRLAAASLALNLLSGAEPEAGFTARQQKMLACRDCGLSGLDAGFTARLLKLQRLWGRELNFTSGRRCAAHNAAVGGVKNSRHLRGQAADVAVSARDQPKFCALAERAGFRRVLPNRRRGYVHLSL